jgi:hypothetical protein
MSSVSSTQSPIPVLTKKRGCRGCKYANAVKRPVLALIRAIVKTRSSIGIEDFGNNLNCPTVKRPICVWIYCGPVSVQQLRITVVSRIKPVLTSE